MKLLSIFLLAGCTTVGEVYLPDGSVGMNISCPGAVRTFASCLEKAGEICGSRGYEVYGREGNSSPYIIGGAQISGDQKFASGSGFLSGGSLVKRNVFVKCK